MSYYITIQSPITDPLLKLLAYLPTQYLEKVIEQELFSRFDDRDFMRLATYLAEKSFDEGGCPIGAVIIDSQSRRILGKGHNLLGQDNDATTHGETAAIRDAGRVAKVKNEGPVDFRQAILYTSLTPCPVCCAQINHRCQFKKIVIGDVSNAPSTVNLLDTGGEVAVAEDPKAVELYRRFMQERSKMHYLDWGGHKKWEEVTR